MSMVLNTNIPSMRAQFALEGSRKEMEEAMERLSTGKRINRAADDAAGLTMVTRMTSQINGLQAATKNANDGIALIQTVESAVGTVRDALQRMRTLAVTAANDTNQNRSSQQEEIVTLQQEIARVSSDTRYNGSLVLNGSFSAKSLHVGSEGGQNILMNIGSVESNKLGAYTVQSNLQTAIISATSGTTANSTDERQDLTITGSNKTRTVDVQTGWTAKEMAKQISAHGGATTVSASARTNAHLFVNKAANSTYTLKINGRATAQFTISKNDVSDAVSKIKAIATETGVSARAESVADQKDNAAYRILLIDETGADIRIQNVEPGSAQTAIKVTTRALNTFVSEPDQMYYIKNLSTGVWDSFITPTSTATTWHTKLEETVLGTNFEAAGVTDDGVEYLQITYAGAGDFDIFTDAAMTKSIFSSTRSTHRVGTAQNDLMVEAVGYDGSTISNHSAADSVVQTEVTGTAQALSSTKTFNTGQKISITNTDQTQAVGVITIRGTHEDGSVAQQQLSQLAVGRTAFTTKEFKTVTSITAAANSNGSSAFTYLVGVRSDAQSLGKYETATDEARIMGNIRLTSSEQFTFSQTAANDESGTTVNNGPTEFFQASGYANLETISSLDMTTAIKASNALVVIDGALEEISTLTSNLGALENRLDYTVSNLMKVEQYTTSARSRIEDADFAMETARLSKAQVLQQAGASMLVQANASNDIILQLLRG
jgi:flagellin